MSRSNVTLYLDNDRLKRLATERGVSASALIEQALDLFESSDGTSLSVVDVPGYKIRVIVDKTHHHNQTISK